MDGHLVDRWAQAKAGLKAALRVAKMDEHVVDKMVAKRAAMKVS